MATGAQTDTGANFISVESTPIPVQRVLLPLDCADLNHQILPLLRGFFAAGEVELVLFGVTALQPALETSATELREAGYQVEIVTVESDAARAIVAYVSATHIDMIALASLGGEGNQRASAFSERVLRSVNVPVLLLRAG